MTYFMTRAHSHHPSLDLSDITLNPSPSCPHSFSRTCILSCSCRSASLGWAFNNAEVLGWAFGNAEVLGLTLGCWGRWIMVLRSAMPVAGLGSCRGSLSSFQRGQVSFVWKIELHHSQWGKWQLSERPSRHVGTKVWDLNVWDVNKMQLRTSPTGRKKKKNSHEEQTGINLLEIYDWVSFQICEPDLALYLHIYTYAYTYTHTHTHKMRCSFHMTMRSIVGNLHALK